jgi:hypothetical protein
VIDAFARNPNWPETGAEATAPSAFFPRYDPSSFTGLLESAVDRHRKSTGLETCSHLLPG